MDVLSRFSHCLFPPLSPKKLINERTSRQFQRNPFLHFHYFREPTFKCQALCPNSITRTLRFLSFDRTRSYSSTPVSSNLSAKAGWLLGLREKKESLPEIVKAGDPVLHEPAQEVSPDEIGSEKIQRIIDDMVKVMRAAPGVGLAAPQIGVPLKIVVLEDTEEYISYARKEETKAQDRRPFDLVVMINPKLRPKSNKTALFFEGCLSIDGCRAVVERFLEVEVTGLDRNGQPIKVYASGWQARIFQHECDHLEGILYVDKMEKKTFRTVENLDLPLPVGCPKLGAR